MTHLEFYAAYFGLLAAGLGAIYCVFNHRLVRRVEPEATPAPRKPHPAE